MQRVTTRDIGLGGRRQWVSCLSNSRKSFTVEYDWHIIYHSIIINNWRKDYE